MVATSATARFAVAALMLASAASVALSAERHSKEATMTFILEAGKEECFYEDVVQNSVVEVEFQVIAGGNLDIDFYVVDAEGVRLEQLWRKTDGVFEHEAANEGIWKVCFGNTFSQVQEKEVFFLWALDAHYDDLHDEGGEGVLNDEGLLQHNLERAAGRIHDTMRTVSNHGFNQKLRHTRHMKTIESNASRIFWFSLMESVFLLLVAGLQV